MNFAHWGKVSHSPSPLPSVSTSRIPLFCDEAGVDLPLDRYRRERERDGEAIIPSRPRARA